MPKSRSFIKRETKESDLSPPPDGLLDEASSNLPETDSPARKKRRIKTEIEIEQTVDESHTTANSRPRRQVAVNKKEIFRGSDQKKKRKAETSDTEEKVLVGGGVKSKRKTKEEKAAEVMPLLPRTIGHNLFIGAHVSSAGGVHNAVANSVHIGANAFALFLKSQRKWVNPPILQDHADSFHENCKSHSYDQGKHVVPHGSYLVNMAHTDPARTQQAYDSYVDDLRRCDKLGIRLYNIHPGNTVSNDRQTAIAHLAKNINRAHKEVPNVTTLLENMAACGNVLGSTFEDLRDTIALVEDKSRIGVCMDTCHAFAAGYDLRSPAAFEETLSQFEDIVGFKYLRAVHLNDSKAPFASHRDLHANIGTGFLGLRAFHNLVNDSRFTGLPLVLETPIDETDAEGTPILDAKGKQKENTNIWATEIKLLESLVGMDADSKEFLIIEKELARKGEPERKRLAEQQERKKEKEAKKAAKGTKGKKRTKKKDDTESDASELSNEE
ncbi:AP endonuclease [Dissoconium aciculare CBS 342.82]|uniref:Apurinic-apyrimidinic endonuclease 1 n=1 Tax=Dissoconium aciculare CBS 342.82 TaxID=1314786 RepID=A0A6J3LQH0_9PEZI|nr:AP endonuclease [Dissoconium aciculare CBS 342.82]KAF1817883.1 AP endonuclease [Dissoconium aciculare CBS 342.82]